MLQVGSEAAEILDGRHGLQRADDAVDGPQDGEDLLRLPPPGLLPACPGMLKAGDPRSGALSGVIDRGTGARRAVPLR